MATSLENMNQSNPLNHFDRMDAQQLQDYYNNLLHQQQQQIQFQQQKMNQALHNTGDLSGIPSLVQPPNNLPMYYIPAPFLPNQMLPNMNLLGGLMSGISPLLQAPQRMKMVAPCRNGLACPFYLQGKCRYYHPPQFLPPLKKKPCRFGETCRYLTNGHCNFFHPASHLKNPEQEGDVLVDRNDNDNETIDYKDVIKENEDKDKDSVLEISQPHDDTSKAPLSVNNERKVEPSESKETISF